VIAHDDHVGAIPRVVADGAREAPQHFVQAPHRGGDLWAVRAVEVPGRVRLFQVQRVEPGFRTAAAAAVAVAVRIIVPVRAVLYKRMSGWS